MYLRIKLIINFESLIFQSKEADDEDTNIDSEDFSEQEQETSSRKSKRIQTQKSPLSLSPTKQLKTVKIIDPKSSLSNDRKQLNGAQFVAAAAAGNFNVSASIGSTSITIDSNANLDLNHLSQNVEMLNSTLKQHSIFLKQVGPYYLVNLGHFFLLFCVVITSHTTFK